MSYRISTKLIGCLLMSTLFSQIVAQPSIYSPISRIGLGSPHSESFHTQIGMGGLGAAYQNPAFANLINPASLGNLQVTTFEVGAYVENNNVNTPEGNFSYMTGNMTQLSLAFPIFNPINDLLERNERPYGLGFMVGLRPNTTTGYNITSTVEDDELGTVDNSFQGNGGTYSLFLNTGFRYNNFSIGAGFQLVFGTLTEESILQFRDRPQLSFGSYQKTDLQINSFQPRIGAQYRFVLNRATKSDGTAGSITEFLNIGASYNFNANVSYSSTRQEFLRLNNSGLNIQDTLALDQEKDRKGTYPGSLVLGTYYKKENKWEAGADLRLGFWDQLNIEDRSNAAANNWNLSIGAGYTPKYNDIDNYLNRITYRLGASIGNDPRLVNNIQMDAYNISFGMTLPFRGKRKVAYGNLFFEYGERAASNIIEEDYFRIGFGISATDNQWFVKSKFN